MKKIFVYGLSALMLFGGCTSSEQFAGAAGGGLLGGIFGSAIGGLMGGPRGSDAGTVIGLVTGAALGVAATSPEVQKRDYSDYDYTSDCYNRRSTVEYSTYSDEAKEMGREYADIEIVNLRFIDTNNNKTVDAGENCKISFEVKNNGSATIYNIAPVISVKGTKNIVISPTAVISEIPSGKSVRYTAEVYANEKLRNGTAEFTVSFAKKNFQYVITTFELATSSRSNKYLYR